MQLQLSMPVRAPTAGEPRQWSSTVSLETRKVSVYRYLRLPPAS